MLEGASDLRKKPDLNVIHQHMPRIRISHNAANRIFARYFPKPVAHHSTLRLPATLRQETAYAAFLTL
jgi:ABC-type transport system involved in cytochrome bd biosynthesis fused ATPase/permease subunit